MTQSLAAVAFVVPDYDSAIAWFRGALGFDLVEDVAVGPGKRWVVVAPPGGAGARLVIAVAADARQRATIGAATGGRVAYFLETDDFARDHSALSARGVALSRSAPARALWRRGGLRRPLGRQVGPVAAGAAGNEAEP